jgi:hypothetical protein
MADEVEGGSGSPERVAFDLTRLVMKYDGQASYNSRDDILDLFEECRRLARHGKRSSV